MLAQIVLVFAFEKQRQIKVSALENAIAWLAIASRSDEGIYFVWAALCALGIDFILKWRCRDFRNDGLVGQ